MQTDAGAKSLEDINRSANSREAWTCGCTTVRCAAVLNARCTVCDKVFEKVSKKKMLSIKKVKVDTIKIGLVNNRLFAKPETAETVVCRHCDNFGEVKVFTQEWDMIKSHVAPCPICFSHEWLSWSEGRRIVQER